MNVQLCLESSETYGVAFLRVLVKQSVVELPFTELAWNIGKSGAKK